MEKGKRPQRKYRAGAHYLEELGMAWRWDV